jgi:hypothetical protein
VRIALKILPGTGRGTMRSMVEGERHKRDLRLWHAPSTGFAGPPPRAGEDL